VYENADRIFDGIIQNDSLDILKKAVDYRQCFIQDLLYTLINNIDYC